MALNLFLFEELQSGMGAGAREVMKESPENYKWRGSEQGVSAKSWQEGSCWEGLKVVGLIKFSRTWEPFQCGF